MKKHFIDIRLWCRKFLLGSLFLSSAAGCLADEQHEVTLDDHLQEITLQVPNANVFVIREKNDDDEKNVKVYVRIENTSEEHVIILFDRSYTEKDLKGGEPSMVFDKKSFPGTRGQRQIETCDPLGSTLHIDNNETTTLPPLTVTVGKPLTLRLPLYMAMRTGRRDNRLLLQGLQVEELTIKVEPKPDADYVRLNADVDSLLNEVGRQVFCTAPGHNSSLEVQEKPYRERKDRLLTEIDSIIDSRGWYQTDKGFLRYDSVRQRLNSIDFSAQERDCGKRHVKKKTSVRRVPKNGHQCRYCNISLQDIYKRLERIYRKLDTAGAGRVRMKASVMSDVEQLYHCCTDSRCRSHAKEWGRSPYRSKIVNYYNRINKL